MFCFMMFPVFSHSSTFSYGVSWGLSLFIPELACVGSTAYKGETRAHVTGYFSPGNRTSTTSSQLTAESSGTAETVDDVPTPAAPPVSCPATLALCRLCSILSVYKTWERQSSTMAIKTKSIMALIPMIMTSNVDAAAVEHGAPVCGFEQAS